MVKRDWDVTTAEGRIALDRYLMKRIGYIDEDPNNPWEGRFVVQTLDEYREYLPDHVEPGWVFTPEGMVALKKWAHEKGLTISSWLEDEGACAEVGRSDPFGWDSFTIEAEDEPTAVALALARALEKMGDDGR